MSRGSDAQEQRATGGYSSEGNTAAGAMNAGASERRDCPGDGGDGDGGGGGDVGALSVRALKLQIFYRLQARGPRGAWTQYWTAFQRFLAARIALEEFHALALALLGEDMHLHNRFVVALLGVAHGGQGSNGAAASVTDPPARNSRPELVMQPRDEAEAAADGAAQLHRPTADARTPVSIKQEPEAATPGRLPPPSVALLGRVLTDGMVLLERHHDRSLDHRHHSSSHHSHHRRHYHHEREHQPHSQGHGHHSQVHSHHSHQPRLEHPPDLEQQQQQQFQSGSRKRSFSSITTSSGDTDDNAASKLLHFASSSHEAHQADDDHHSAKLLIGLGMASARISPARSDEQRSQRSASPDDGDKHRVAASRHDGDTRGDG